MIGRGSGHVRYTLGDMVELRGVRKRYGDRVAVDGVDLRAGRGRTVLIGPSGCGKSTLLRMMIGLIRPDDGEVLFEGQPLTRQNILHVRRKIGYVVQDGGLFPHLSAHKNVTLVPQYLKWDRNRLEARVAELAELTRLPRDLLANLPHELSGGQRQRVSLMRALVLDPDVLLLDEPLAALDPMVRRDLQQDLLDIFKRLGKTVVLVTHDIGEAAFFGDRIILLRDGGIVQEGTWRDLVDRPADEFVTRFINAQRSPAFVPEARE